MGEGKVYGRKPTTKNTRRFLIYIVPLIITENGKNRTKIRNSPDFFSLKVTREI